MAATPSLHPAEAPIVENAVEGRRQEFALGRACARDALARLGHARVPILRGADRAPIWPRGIVGSITHSRGFCAAVVSRRREVSSLGVDSEEATPLAPELVSLICGPSERARMGASPDLELAMLIFSAKESAFKCYFPLARRMLDFLDMEIDFARGSGEFRARLVRDELPSARGARAFTGRFVRTQTHWLTGVALRAGDVQRGAPD